MATRTLTIAAVCLTTLSDFYFFTSGTATPPKMTTSGSRLTSSLKVRISDQSTPSELKVAIHNKDPSRTITFLSWDTAFDPQAINSGVLCLENADTDEEIPSPDMKLNRKLPPPRDDLIEISPGSTVTKIVALKSPWIPTDGQRYRAHFQGSWKAAWSKAAAQVTDEELASVTGDMDSQSNFHTDKFEMQLGKQ